MKPETARVGLGYALAGTIFAMTYAVVVATGTLMMIFVVMAGIRGGSVVDLLYDVFPLFRGGGQAGHLPRAAYAIFVVYVAMASWIAIERRRRLLRKWSRLAQRV